MTVVALDAGSSAVRCLAFDDHAEPLPGVAARGPVAIAYGADGVATFDAQAYVDAALACLDEVAGHRSLGTVTHVALAAQWHALVLVDGGARPFGPVITWADSRAAAAVPPESRRERSHSGRNGPPGVSARTGCPVHPQYWTLRIPHFRRPGARYWGLGDVLRHAVTGVPGTTPSMASATGLLNLQDLDWDAEALDLAGVTPDDLPPLMPTRGGRLSDAAARRWPALAGAEVVGPVGDGAASSLGSGCDRPGRAAVTIGTSTAVRVVHDRAGAAPPPGGFWRYLLDEDRALTGRAWSAGGNVLTWAQAHLRLPEGELDAALHADAPDPGPVVALPRMFGGRPPDAYPAGAGALLGLGPSDGPVRLLAALLQGVACEVADGIDAFAPAEVIDVVAGGGALAASRWWRQRLCDLAGRPMRIADQPEIAARGVAALALDVDVPLPEGRLEPSADPACAGYRARYRAARGLFDD